MPHKITIAIDGWKTSVTKYARRNVCHLILFRGRPVVMAGFIQAGVVLFVVALTPLTARALDLSISRTKVFIDTNNNPKDFGRETDASKDSLISATVRFPRSGVAYVTGTVRAVVDGDGQQVVNRGNHALWIDDDTQHRNVPVEATLVTTEPVLKTSPNDYLNHHYVLTTALQQYKVAANTSRTFYLRRNDSNLVNEVTSQKGATRATRYYWATLTVYFQ